MGSGLTEQEGRPKSSIRPTRSPSHTRGWHRRQRWIKPSSRRTAPSPRGHARLLPSAPRSSGRGRRSRATAGLKEKVFNRSFSGLVVYVDKIKPPDTRLAGILISDERNPHEQSTIVARKGLVIPDEDNETITIRLTDGSVFGTDSDGAGTHISRFGTYDLTIHPGEALGVIHHDPQEMNLAELLGVIARGRALGHRDYEAETEYAQKFTVPVATLLFALLGVTMGLKPARGGQSERFGICLAFFFLYYVLMKAGEALAEAGRLNAFVAMSIPDVFFAVLAVWLFHRSATDRADQSRGPGDAIWDLVERIGPHREAA